MLMFKIPRYCKIHVFLEGYFFRLGVIHFFPFLQSLFLLREPKRGLERAKNQKHTGKKCANHDKIDFATKQRKFKPNIFSRVPDFQGTRFPQIELPCFKTIQIFRRKSIKKSIQIIICGSVIFTSANFHQINQIPLLTTSDPPLTSFF